VIGEQHNGGVFGVCALGSSRFVSCSEDSTLRVWRV